MLSLSPRAAGAWRPRIVSTIAHRGTGIDDVVAAIEAHREWSAGSGELQRRRHRRARDEIEAIALTGLRQRFAGMHGDSRLDDLAAAVLAGELDPYSAADRIVEAL